MNDNRDINKDRGKQERRRERPPHKELPVDGYREEIENTIASNSSSIVIGETGSGKTTRVPDFFLDKFPNARIAITQPRRIAARSVSGYVAASRGERIGETVGFQVKSEKETSADTRATFMTDGILLRKLQNDPLIAEYDAVMVDEAHERSLNIDFLLGLLKMAQAARAEQQLPELKIIVTSATIEKEKFAEYFNQAPAVEVPGRLHPVDVKYFPPGEKEKYTEAAARLVKNLANNPDSGDILIFMPGEAEIRDTIDQIKKLDVTGIDVMPLFGTMSPEDQDKIFAANPKKKVIVSTNIAETSVTIDGIKTVIDSGVIKQKQLNNQTGVEALLPTDHAQSGCKQRAGRAGRTAPGTCYRLYTEGNFNNRPEFSTPEIRRTSLDHVVLAMKKMNIQDVRNFDFIDPPNRKAIEDAIEKLQALGALDDSENLTKIGEIMADMPLSPEMGRMLIEADKHGCTESVAIIAALSGERSIFFRPKEKEAEADEAHAKFKTHGSDYLTMLKVWDRWAESGFHPGWAHENFINGRQLYEARETLNQIADFLRQSGVAIQDRDASLDDIQKCIASGLLHNLYAKGPRYSFDKVRTSDRSRFGYSPEVFIFPGSAGFAGVKRESKDAPGSYPIYDPVRIFVGSDIKTKESEKTDRYSGERIKEQRTYAHRIQPLKPEWLEEIAPHLVVESDGTARYDLETDKVVESGYKTLKNTIVELGKFNREPAPENRAKALSDAIFFGYIDLPARTENEKILTRISETAARYPDRIQIPNLRDFYAANLGEAKNAKDVLALGDKLKLKFEDYCSPEIIAEIERDFPSTISVMGHNLTVTYQRDTYYYGRGIQATVEIPRSLLHEPNFHEIPKFGGPQVQDIRYKLEGSTSNGWDDLGKLQRQDQAEIAHEKRNATEMAEFKIKYNRIAPKIEAQLLNAERFRDIPAMQELQLYWGAINRTLESGIGGGGGLDIYYTYVARASRALEDALTRGAFADLRGMFAGNEVVQSPITKEEPKAAPLPKIEAPKQEKIINPEEATAQAKEQIAELKTLIATIRATKIDKDRLGKQTEKIQGAVDKTRGLNRELLDIEDSFGTIVNDKARSRLGDLNRRVEKVAAEIAFLTNINEKWVEDFRRNNTILETLAAEQDITLTPEILEKLKPQLTELAQQKPQPEDLPLVIEALLIESL